MEVYIKAEDLNRWIVKHLPPNKDLYSVDDLIAAIEELDGEIDDLKEKIEELENKDEEGNNSWNDR